MTKVVMSAVVGGAMVFAATAATDAAHKNVMANPTSSRTESAPKSALIRLAAAGSDMDFQTPEMTAAAMRPLIPAKPDCVLPISTSTEPPAPTGKHFEIADKLKLAFFENVQDVEKNKWGSAAGNSFEQHPELSGEYTVQEDGTISVPMLGQFDVLSLTPKDLQQEMATAFDKALGRKGFVTIVSVERPPIYVLGPVKNPASYPYVSGMTVLHAVTLAGGFPREDNNEPWQKLERVRETTKRLTTLEALSELLARQTVLMAVRDTVRATAPKQLVDLVGQNRADAMIAVEQDREGAAVAAHKARLASADEAIRVAQEQVTMLSTKGRSLDSQDQTIAALKHRADGIDTLYRQGALNNNLQIDAHYKVSEAERVRQDMIAQVGQARAAVVKAQDDRERLDTDWRAEIDQQLMALDRQIADARREDATSEGVLGTLQVGYSTPPASAISYEIVRQTVKGPVAFTATGMSVLIPGDLVRVSTNGDDGKGAPSQPGQPNINTRPAAQPVSTGCR